ncbi:MAG: 50S ribosomal protein L21 [Acidimicrobiia bacterium]
MYAVVKTGGKQYRVTEGQRLDVERLPGARGVPEDRAEEVVFDPVLVVDGETVLSTPDQLAGAQVRARVVGESKGPKIDGFTYKNKTNQRKRWGHRQKYSTIEIVGIAPGSGVSPRAEG